MLYQLVIENRMREQTWTDIPYSSQPGAYVSPSDAIMSPASQKLSSFKQRQMNKQ